MHFNDISVSILKYLVIFNLLVEFLSSSYESNDDIEIILEDSDEFVEDSFKMVYQEKPIRGLEVGEGFESEQVI